MSLDGERDEGVRLAKRVAAQQGCSRSQAEALISAGAVQVDGQVVTDPARRIPDGAHLQVSDLTPVRALTVLFHKPAGMSAADALRQVWPTLSLGPVPPPGFQEWLALPQEASGLSVWSSERPVTRRLLDRERPLETEWLLSMPLAAGHAVMASLQSGGVRTSLGNERDGLGQWRLVCKGDPGLELVNFLDARQLTRGWTLRRQRVGRLGLSPLAPGQGRLRRDFEKF